MRNNFIKLKDVAVIAIVGTLYWCIVSMLFETELLTNFSNMIKIGWVNEYNERSTISFSTTEFLLFIPYDICYTIFFTLFIWKLRIFDERKIFANIAFFIWCLALVFSLVNTLRDFYIFLNFNKDTIMSPDSWEATNPTAYFLLFSLGGATWAIINNSLNFISNLALLVLFISLLKKHRAIGVTGSLTLLICMIVYVRPIPFVIVGLGWIALFVVVLWKIKENEIKEQAYSVNRSLILSISICLLYALFVFMSLTKGGNFVSDPLKAYQGCTTDSVLVQKQYEAVMKNVTQRFASNPEKVPDLLRPVNATQTFTFDENGRITTCWAFEFREQGLGNMKIYNNVLLVIDGNSYYYSYDEMYQMREDKYLRLSALMINGIWKPATYYIDFTWKCVGYESCNRYGSERTEVHGWEDFLGNAKNIGIDLSIKELPLIKKADENDNTYKEYMEMYQLNN